MPGYCFSCTSWLQNNKVELFLWVGGRCRLVDELAGHLGGPVVEAADDSGLSVQEDPPGEVVVDWIVDSVVHHRSSQTSSKYKEGVVGWIVDSVVNHQSSRGGPKHQRSSLASGWAGTFVSVWTGGAG